MSLLKQLTTNTRGVNLTNKINPWYLEQDGVVFLHESGVEVGLQMWLPPSSSVTTEQVERLFETYQSILEAGQIEKSRVRFMIFHRPTTDDEIIELNYPPTNDPMQSALISSERRANERRVLNGEYKQHEAFIFIHIPDQRTGVARSDLRAYNDAEFEQIMMLATEERERIITALANAQVPATPILDDEPFRMLYRYYNIGSVADPVPPYDWNIEVPNVTRDELRLDESIRPRTLRAQIINSDILTPRSSYLLNRDAHIVVADMTNYGERGYPGVADDVMAVFRNHTYMYIVDVKYANEANIKTRVERNITAMEKEADSGKREATARAAKMNQEMLEAYYHGGRWVHFGMSMIVVCDSEAEVRQIARTIKNTWSDARFGQHQMSFGDHSNWDQFTVNLAPFGGKSTMWLHDQQVGSVTSFLPFYGPWYNTGGVTLGVFENAHGGQQRITLPKGSEGAPHMAVIGSSRSGKSFTIQKLLMNLYMQGAYLRIMDIKNDYAPLCSWLRGQFIPFSLGAKFATETIGPDGSVQPAGTPVRYNIFEGTNRDLTPDEERDITAFVKALLIASYKPEWGTIISAGVKSYVRTCTQLIDGQPVFEGGTLGGFFDFMYGLQRIGEIGLQDSPEHRKHVRDIAIALQEFTQGYYGTLFNGRSTINMTSRVTVFDMSGIGDDQMLMGAVTTIINKMVWENAKKRTDLTARIVLLSEESGVTGKIPEVKEMLNTVILSGAAYNLMEIITAQNYKHIEALDGVLNNVTRFIMGRCESKEASLIGQMLELNEEQEANLKRLSRKDGEYNELMVREVKPDGVEVGVIRYRPTSLEYCLFSSDAKDKTRRAQIMTETDGDMELAVQRMVSEFEAARRTRVA